MMLSIVLEAAFRSLLMALAVWGCVSLLRMRAVLALKVTWVMVLLAAATMPILMRAPLPAMNRALQIPLRNLPIFRKPATASATNVVSMNRISAPKPAAAHRAVSSSDQGTLTLVAANGASLTFVQPVQPVQPTQPVQPNAAASKETVVPKAVDTIVASPNPPAQLLLTVWQKAVSYWTLTRIAILAVALYLTVGTLLLLRSFLGLVMAFRLIIRSQPVQTAALESSTHLKVRASRHISSPVTIGSTILLPASYTEWDQTKLRIVLAHEQSHVRQGDFYLQLVAAIHAAIFWFSPLGWWLQRKLSDLGEALSDRAGLEQAPDPATYAQILLEFAAMPRKHSIFQPAAGVAMARSSNLSSRIERVLNATTLRPVLQGGRRHAILAVILVPAILAAVVVGIRFVPAVEAAQVNSSAPVTLHMILTSPGTLPRIVKALYTPQAPPAPAAPVIAPVAPDAPTTAPVAPDAPAIAPVAPEVEALEAPEPPEPFKDDHGSSYMHISDDDGDSFAIISGEKSNVYINGHHQVDLDKAKKKYHGNFIWFQRGDKSYVITDPALVAQAQAEFKTDPRLVIKQQQLEKMQADLNLKMEKMRPEMEAAMKPTPEFQEEMKKLSSELAELQSEKFKKMTADISKEFTQEKLAELQEKIGDIQGHIGELQGEMGERAGEIGERQGELGEKMGKLGEEMGRIGEEQGRKAEAAARRMQSVLDQAVKDGKAKPVE